MTPLTMHAKTKSILTITSLIALGVLIHVIPAEARGGHGFGRHYGAHRMAGGGFASDRRHGDDAYVKAAAEEEDKLLNTRVKSICRGC
jgi:hypothetical protein